MINESQNIEFKESWRDDNLKWICGFANAQGGTLYIGIRDDGDICGILDAKKLMEDIPNKVRDLLGILIHVNLKEKNGLEYLEIIIDPYPYPISYKGQYHVRSGCTKQELKGAALDQFLLRKQGRTWDSVPLPYIKVEDLDISTFDLFRKYAQKSGRMEEIALLDNNKDLLEKLRLCEGEYLKRAAALLFHPDPEKYITGASVKIGYFKNDSDLLYQDEIQGNLFQQVRIIMDLLTTKYLKASIRYEDIQRIEELPVPRSALREAILNAIVHKDYASATPIQISIYDEKMMIWNCGVLPDNWLVETLLKKHGSRPYNPDIANVFFRAGEIEAWGQGIERIMSACKEAGCKEPEYRYDGTGLWTIFEFKVSERKTSPITNLKTSLKTNLKLTELQQEVLRFLKEHPHALRQELVDSIEGATLGGVKYNIARLQEIGLLKRIGSNRNGYWDVIDNK